MLGKFEVFRNIFRRIEFYIKDLLLGKEFILSWVGISRVKEGEGLVIGGRDLEEVETK